MKYNYFYLVGMLVLLSFFLRTNHEEPAAPKKTVVAKAVAPTALKPARAPAAVAPLTSMSNILFQFTQQSPQLEDLVRSLKQQGQEPLLVKDANPFTGEMTIVRTQKPAPGTRYFHAQYFTNDDRKNVVQHMSFDVAPGPAALAEVRHALEQSFADLSSPSVERDGFTEWTLNDGYVLWIKNQQWEDLRDDPFNAYVPEDVGTIRVAVELNPEFVD